MLFPGSVELVRLAVKLGVPVAGLRAVVLLTGYGVVMVELIIVVELIVEVVLGVMLVGETEVPLAPVPDPGKL